MHTRELEVELGRLELEVGLGLGVGLDEGRQVALVHVELEGVDLDDVRAHAVQKARVVRDDDGGHVREAVEVVLHPFDVVHIQVVRGLYGVEGAGVGLCELQFGQTVRLHESKWAARTLA